MIGAFAPAAVDLAPGLIATLQGLLAGLAGLGGLCALVLGLRRSAVTRAHRASGDLAICDRAICDLAIR